MAFSYDPSGFQYAPLTPKLDGGSLLAGIKPLQIPQQSPVQISALPAWTVPNLPTPPRVQGIESGITTAINAIGQGVTAAYKDKREDEREARKAKIAADTKLAEQEETKRHHLELERNAKERIKNVLPADWGTDDESTASVLRDAPSVANQTQPTETSVDTRYQRHAPIKGGSFESINLPEEEDANGFSLQSISSPLANLTSPAPLEAAPSLSGENALNALANTDWGKVTGNYVAGTGAGPAIVPPSLQPDWLRKPKAVTSRLSNLGGFPDGSLERTDEYLADTQKALSQIPSPAPTPAPEAPKFGVPKAAFRSYEDARKYIESQAGNPNWYAEGTPKLDKSGLFIIPWKQQDPSLRLAREEAQKTREMTAKSAAENRLENTIMRESRAFGLQKPVANFLRAGGVKELLPPFLSAYESAKLHPEASGAADVSMLDSFGRAESGGRITVSQAHLIENAMSLKDKWLTKTGGKIEGGGFLPQSVRDQMLRELTENYNIGADSANKVVTATKQRLKTSGIPEEKAGVYYFFGGHTPETEVMLKSDALERIKSSREEMAKLIAEKSQANPKNADIIDRRIQELKRTAKILHDRYLDEVGVESSLLGMKQIRDISIPEGFSGGDVGQVEVVPQ